MLDLNLSPLALRLPYNVRLILQDAPGVIKQRANAFYGLIFAAIALGFIFAYFFDESSFILLTVLSKLRSLLS